WDASPACTRCSSSDPVRPCAAPTPSPWRSRWRSGWTARPSR
ncbi:MAG: Sulfur carrier protein FdhD, partial [uncultured Friedmanniella sp.]